MLQTGGILGNGNWFLGLQLIMLSHPSIQRPLGPWARGEKTQLWCQKISMWQTGKGSRRELLISKFQDTCATQFGNPCKLNQSESAVFKFSPKNGNKYLIASLAWHQSEEWEIQKDSQYWTWDYCVLYFTVVHYNTVECTLLLILGPKFPQIHSIEHVYFPICNKCKNFLTFMFLLTNSLLRAE